MSASPLCAEAMAAPVPWATKLTVIQGYLASKACFMVPVVLPLIPMSSSPVSRRLVVVATLKVEGVGVGVGVAVGDVGLEVGFDVIPGFCVAPGLELGVLVAFGDCPGEVVGVAVACGLVGCWV